MACPSAEYRITPTNNIAITTNTTTTTTTMTTTTTITTTAVAATTLSCSVVCSQIGALVSEPSASRDDSDKAGDDYRANSPMTIRSDSRQLSSIDQLLLGQLPGFGTSLSPSLTETTMTTTAAQVVRIIDIQKCERKSRGASSDYDNQPQLASWSGYQQQQQQLQPGPSTSSQEQKTWTTSSPTSQQQQQTARPSSGSNQKQPSGETLSSFESDYDLLVYLGETETEDIVETERSLDYQDQTWRQSICGGASLAPTIDDSLNGDGFASSTGFTNSNNHAVSYHAARRDEDDFDLLNTPTPTAATFGSGSPFFTPPTAASSFGASRHPTTTTGTTSNSSRGLAGVVDSNTLLDKQTTDIKGGHLKRADDINLESDDCDNEVSLVFHQSDKQTNSARRISPVARVAQRTVPEKTHQVPDILASDRIGRQQHSDKSPQHKSNAKFGDKFVSLFHNRVPAEISHTRDDVKVQQHQAESIMGQPRHESNKSTSTSKISSQSTSHYPQHRTEPMMHEVPTQTGGVQSSSSDAAELDRLLAEMNESLDLKSLARYDPMAGRYPSSTTYGPHQQQHSRSQTLNIRDGSVQQHQHMDYRNKSPTIQQQYRSAPKNTSQSSTNLNAAGSKQNLTGEWVRSVSKNSESQRENLVAESESSILDEYDGASRMLEQMISDQLLDRGLKSEQQSEISTSRAPIRPGRSAVAASNKLGSMVAADCFPDGRNRTRSIDNESPTKSAGPTRKVSTCSSSVATEGSVVLNKPQGTSQLVRTAVVSATDGMPNERDIERRARLSANREAVRKFAGRTVRQSNSFDQSLSSSNPKSSNVDAKDSLQQPLASRSFDSMEPAVAATLNSNNNSSAEDRPPTPPEVDYNDGSSIIVMHEVDHEGGKVIRLEAAEFSQDEIGSDIDDLARSKPTNETQIDKMKRRTLSSMRSMRDKFNDFITINKANHNQVYESQRANLKQQPDANKSLAHDKSRSQQQQKAPQPPRRSSSIGSQNSNNQSRSASENRRSRLDGENGTATELKRATQQQRESRSRLPRERPPKQSFGQQIRERLSRSKSRFSKFLKSSSARAKSSPNIKEKELRDESKVDDSELFQPSDIARNSGEAMAIMKRDSFDESLDRHLKANLDKAVSKKQSSSSSSSSDLSGLDISKNNSRSRPRSRAKHEGFQSDREKSKEKRPSSLISLRRLGSFRSKKQSSPAEDFDSMQVKTSDEIPTAASRRRSRKNKRNQSKSPFGPAAENSSSVSPINNQGSLAITTDYFGEKAPLKVDSGDEKLPEQEPADLKLRNNQNATTLLEVHREAASDNRSAKSWNQDSTTINCTRKPNRSQSMKSISNERTNRATTESPDIAKQQLGKRTVSSSNLQQRRLPSSVNSFRPTSACEQRDFASRINQDEDIEGKQMDESRAGSAMTPTPIGLSSDPLVGRRLESTKPPQLEHTKSRLTPIRARGSAMIDDIKHKCSELFNSPDQQSRGRQSRIIASSASPQAQVAPSSPNSPAPPVRPPRKRGLQQRSKSVSARPGIASPVSGEQPDVAQQFHEVKLRAATPPGSSLDRGHSSQAQQIERSQQQQHRQSPVGEKLASFAQQFKHSAAEFFLQPAADSKRVQQRQSRDRAPLRAPDETIVSANDLHEWRPVIKSNRPASSSSFRVLGAKDKRNDESTVAPHSIGEIRGGLVASERDGSLPAAHKQQQQQSSPDSDSTWESTCDDEDAPAEAHEQLHSSKIASNQTKSDEPSDESSAAGSRVASEASNTKQQQHAVTTCGAGTADEQVAGGNSNRLHLASAVAGAGAEATEVAVGHKFDDKERDGNNNNDGEELLHSSEGYQQRAIEAGFRQKRVYDCDAKVSEDNLRITHHQKQKQAAILGEGIAADDETDEKHKHNRSKQVDDRLVQSQQQRRPSMKNSDHEDQQRTATIHSDSKPFKFNANLPSPSQLLQESFKEENSTKFSLNEGASRFADTERNSEKEPNSVQEDEKMVRVALSSCQKVEAQQSPNNSSNLKRDPPQAENIATLQDQEPQAVDSSENRLSIYDNVSQSDASPRREMRSSDEDTRKRHWRRRATPPHVPAKPSHLKSSGVDLASRPHATATIAQQQHQEERKSSSSDDDDWSTGDVVLEPKKSPEIEHSRVLIEQQQQQQQQPSTGAQRSERKLVTMTSIIHDPIDDLMEARPSGRISLQSQNLNASQTSEGRVSQSGSLLQRRDSNFGTDNEFNVDSDDTDSSFAAAAASRQRLVKKFEQISNKSKGIEQPRAKFPAFKEGKTATSSSGRSDSLVKRLARNFDQTVQEQPAAYGGRPPVAPPKKLLQTSIVMKSLDDDSAADWCDARSADLVVDENEIAEFLQDFDREPATEQQQQKQTALVSGRNSDNQQHLKRSTTSGTSATIVEISAQEASEACSSVSTGADPFVTVADSTLGEGDDDDDDDEHQLKGYAERQPRQLTAAGTTSDDDTLNDGELKDEDDDVLTENQDQLFVDEENDLTESYTSARGTLPRVSEEQRRPQQQQQQENQGKDLSSLNSRLDSRASSVTSRLPLARDATCLSNPASENDSITAFASDLAENTSLHAACDPTIPPFEARPNPEIRSNNNNNNNVIIAEYFETAINTQPAAPLISDDSKGQTSSRLSQSDEGENRRTNLIDDHFKNSLNHIIARRSSSSSSLAAGQVIGTAQEVSKAEFQVQQQMSGSSGGHSNQQPESKEANKKKERKKKKKTSKGSSPSSRELRGLGRLYHALLGGSKHSSGLKKAAKTDETGPDYIHSSSSSDCSSSAEFSSDSEDDDRESMDDRKLAEAAKKCSRIYEELERILERRLAKENRKPTSEVSALKQESQTTKAITASESLLRSNDDEFRQATTSDLLAEREEDGAETGCDMGYELDYEESLSNIMAGDSVGANLQRQQPRESSSTEDRVSLSSSSLSSESIPEVRQRKNLQKLYLVVNEICSSEAKFVDTLRLLNVDFRQHILGSSTSQSSSSPIPPERLNSMLKHLPQLQALNENLLAELEQARNLWPRTQKIAHVLVKTGPFLKHYSTYIREFESMQQQYNENLKKYPQFAEKVRQFEASERCSKLTIQHHILKPIQRIPQYRLMLQQYLHNLKPDDVDYEDTVNALEVVSRVAEHANQSMSEGVNFAKLLALQAKIVGKQRDIVQPGRVFIKEGELMKVCRKQIQPRWFVLLNDALLYLTQVQSSDILFLKNELPLDGCLVSVAGETDEQSRPVGGGDDGELESRDHPNELSRVQQQKPAVSEKEFSVSTRTRSFALIAKTRAERDEWVSALRRTVEEYMAKRRSFISSIRRQQHDSDQSATSSEAANELIDGVPSLSRLPTDKDGMMNEEAQPKQEQQQQYLLGQMAPIWTPDSRVSMCQLCTSSFSALFRRHHCRACGRVVCSACSSNKAPLIYLKCRAARVCDDCFDTLKANIHLYYLPANTLRAALSPGSESLAPGGGLEPLIGEEELRRLDEHFRTLLKSQFTRTTSLSRLASSKKSTSAMVKKKKSKSKLPLFSSSKANENVVVVTPPTPTTSK